MKMKNRTKVIIAVVIIIILLASILFIYSSTWKTILGTVQDAKKKVTVEPGMIRFSQPYKGISFTHSLWIYVDDWSYRNMEEKYILSNDKFKMFLGKQNNNLYIEIPLEKTNHPERIVYENLPLQKWVNIVLILDNRNLDLWLNGKLYHSRHLSNVPAFQENKAIEYTPHRGFSGHISRIYHYERPITKKTIESIFLLGPISYNPFIRLYEFFKKKIALSLKTQPICLNS
jgi:hypothetical protein